MSGFVTTTFTVPAACVPVIAVIVVAFTTTTDVAATPPIETVAPLAKPVPVIVTEVFPAVGPLVGAMDGDDGGMGAEYVKPAVSVPVWKSGFVTTTSTVPAAWAPVVAVIDVELPTLTPVADTSPIATVAPETKFVPVIVTDVPPPRRAARGLMQATVGGGPPPPPRRRGSRRRRPRRASGPRTARSSRVEDERRVGLQPPRCGSSS